MVGHKNNGYRQSFDKMRSVSYAAHSIHLTWETRLEHDYRPCAYIQSSYVLLARPESHGLGGRSSSGRLQEEEVIDRWI